MNAETKISRNVFQRLSDARERFHQNERTKTGKASNRNYFELGDFLPDALRIFKEEGLSTTPVTFREGVASMEVVNMDDPTERIACESPMGSADLKGCHEVQNIGAVQTYQRRYLWMNVLELCEHDRVSESEPLSEMPDEEWALLVNLREASGANVPAMLKHLNITLPDNNLRLLSQTDYARVVDAMKTKLAKKAKEETDAKATENA